MVCSAAMHLVCKLSLHSVVWLASSLSLTLVARPSQTVLYLFIIIIIIITGQFSKNCNVPTRYLFNGIHFHLCVMGIPTLSPYTALSQTAVIGLVTLNFVIRYMDYG